MASHADINEYFSDFSYYIIIIITLKLIVFKNRNIFLNFAAFCSFVDLLPIRLKTGPISFLMKYRLICFFKVLSDGNLIWL